MTIYFTATEPTSEKFFRERLNEYELQFSATLADVPADAEFYRSLSIPRLKVRSWILIRI